MYYYKARKEGYMSLGVKLRRRSKKVSSIHIIFHHHGLLGLHDSRGAGPIKVCVRYTRGSG